MSAAAALSRLKGLCAASEQCSFDLRKKLSNWGIPSSVAATIIRRLEQERFLDDSRFALAYAHDKLMFNGWGRLKISQGLRAKQMPRNVIDEAIDALDASYYRKRAFAVMRAKAAQMEPDRESKMKLLRFGASRGFESALIVKIINSGLLWRQQED